MVLAESSAAQVARGLVQSAAGLTIGALFRLQVQSGPDRIALEQDGRQMRYAELNERVNRLAQALAARGITRGDRVAVLAENCCEYVELQLAVAKLGVLLACQNWRQADDELRFCLHLAEAKLIVVSERHAARLATIDHGIADVVVLGEPYEHMLAYARADEPPEVADPEDGMLVLYTSGTTGFPKGAVISQRAMVARTVISQLDKPVGSDDTYIAWTPLFHMGSTDNAYGTLTRGGKVVVMDGFDAGKIVEIIGREEIGWLTVIPGVIDRIIDEVHRGGIKAKGIRMMGVMADLVPPAKIAELTTLLQAPYGNSFGSTETGSPPASRGKIGIGEIPPKLSKVQSSLCHIRLVDPDDNDVPDGEPGELAMRGPSLFSGYWRQPEETAEAFRGGWYHMGDVFVRNPDATLDFVDRRKYLIKSGGENIYPAEVERVLMAQPQVAEAAVVRRADAKWGEVPVAFVVTRDATITAEEIIAACRGKIAGYKLPKEVRFIDEADLPRNTSGKIERQKLEALLQQDAPA